MNIEHDKNKKMFVMPVEGGIARIEYAMSGNLMLLVHSEVPHELRGKGIGKELVLGTFEKLTEEGYQAKAICSYIRAVKNRSPKWQNVIL